MGVLDDVVLGLRLAGVAADAALLAELLEAGHPAGEQLVHVGLVAGVEHDAVARRVEDPVHGDGELDHAEVGPEVAAGPRAGPDEEVADLGGQLVELGCAQTPQVARGRDLLQAHPFTVTTDTARDRFGRAAVSEGRFRPYGGA